MKKKQFSMAEYANSMAADILKSEAPNRRKIASMLALLAVEFGNYIDLYAETEGMKMESEDKERREDG